MPPVHFENGQNANNDLKPTNAKKTLMKTRKNITGPHASAYFENGSNAKNSHESEKMYNRATCLCVFQKWAKDQKQLKSTELNKKFHN